MSDAGRTLAVAEAYEWAIDVFESMDREDALDYLRRVAARQRESYEREICMRGSRGSWVLSLRLIFVSCRRLSPTG